MFNFASYVFSIMEIIQNLDSSNKKQLQLF